MATTNAARTFASAMAMVLFLCAPAYAQQKAPSLFTVANVNAAAEAANAVEAKKLATQSAETHAFRLLISRLADYRSATRIPDLPAEQIERLVSDIDVRGEGVSGTSYVATFGVTFSERAIVGLLRQHGVAPIVDRGPEIHGEVRSRASILSTRKSRRNLRRPVAISPRRSQMPTLRIPLPVWRRSNCNIRRRKSSWPWRSRIAAEIA